MKFIWCDTETTGLKPENAAPFQVAMIFVSTQKINGEKVKDETERIFYMNPFDVSGIEYNEDAGKVHGYSKEIIESFEPSKIVCKKIAEFLDYCEKFRNEEKLFLCGYNVGFDNDHMISIFKHHGIDFTQYFHKNYLDVFEQVKTAGVQKILPYLPNRKLVTIAEFLHVDLSNAHDAMGDIKATREVAKSLANLGVPLK